MDRDYFTKVRHEIAPLLPASATRIVDVGCGAGSTSDWLKREKFPAATFVGLEGNPELRDDLARIVDEVHIVDLDAPLPDVGFVDLALFLDVLEHLKDPGRVLRSVTAGMPVGGTVIVSVPNITHFTIIVPMLTRAEFRYTDSGILDRTHLRFFDRHGALSLLESNGFQPTSVTRNGLSNPKSRVVNAATFGWFGDHLTRQFVMVGTKMDGPVGEAGRGAIRWV